MLRSVVEKGSAATLPVTADLRDHRAMWPSQLDSLRSETTAFGDALARRFFDTPPLESTPPAESRRLRLAGEGAFPAPTLLDRAEEREIGPEEIPVRIIRPVGEVKAMYLHFHGGGWVIGSRMAHDVLLADLADAASVAVMSVGYPLAPEHPYPAAPDTGEAAARWLIENAAAEFGTSRLIVGGESAGAHLSLVTLLRLRDAGLGDAFCGANLTYGCFDLSGTPSVHAWSARLILSPENLRFFFDSFCGNRTASERRHPDISPLYADLRGLPPIFAPVGTRDPLLDDTLLLHHRIRHLGGAVDMRLYPDAFHGFTLFPHAMQEAAQADLHEWLRAIATN